MSYELWIVSCSYEIMQIYKDFVELQVFGMTFSLLIFIFNLESVWILFQV